MSWKTLEESDPERAASTVYDAGRPIYHMWKRE